MVYVTVLSLKKYLTSKIEKKTFNIFLRFRPPEKYVLELMTNVKFSFSESGRGSVHIPLKPIFLFEILNF